MKIGNLVMPNGIGSLNEAQKPSATNAFGDMLEKAVGEVANNQKKAEALSTAAAQGEPVAMHEVIEAVGKAELTLQTMLTVRDKATEAYKEILNMPI